MEYKKDMEYTYNGISSVTMDAISFVFDYKI